MMRRALNITATKRDLLRLVADGGSDIIITRSGEPQATLQPAYPITGNRELPFLIILAARPSGARQIDKSFALYQRIAPLCQPPVWVYSRETEALLGRVEEELGNHDPIAVECAKSEQPIITSIKAGLTTCALPEKSWFTFLFLSRPPALAALEFIFKQRHAAQAAGKGLIVPTREGHPSHPLLFSAAYKKQILRTRKELGIPHIVKRHRADSFFCELQT